MINSLPTSLPDTHRRFLTASIDAFQDDTRIVGIAVGGSFLTNTMDEFSDLDLVIATEPHLHGDVMDDRIHIAGTLGPLVAAFTGEHVGEPRLLVCLYEGTVPLHVDLKFVSLLDFAERIEDPTVLWEREGRLAGALAVGNAEYPMPNRQWIEDRFWVWVHYATTKLARSELFEVLDVLTFLRAKVLGPLAFVSVGARPAGVRRFERFAPNHVERLQATIATHDAVDCRRALLACVDLYRILRSGGAGIEIRESAERTAMNYLSYLESRGGLTPVCT